MSDLFPKAGFLKLGYHKGQVEAFFDSAKQAYERPPLEPGALSAFDVRRTAFDLRRGGYAMHDVDQALDRLEAALLARLRDQFIAQYGQQAWMQMLAQRAQVLYPRLRRPRGQRFARPSGFKRGYDVRDVDALLGRLVTFFDKGVPVTPDELRKATFRRKSGRGGYDERTVDVYLDRAVEILQAAQ